MGYPSEILVNARKRVESKREQIIANSYIKKAEIAKKCPSAILLEREIASTSARLSGAVLARKNIEDALLEIKEFNLTKRKELSNLLIANGFAPNALEPTFYCDICNDSGIYNDAVCQCLKSVQRELMYQRLGSIATSLEYQFDTFDLKWYTAKPLVEGGPSARDLMKKNLKKCANYAESFSSNSGNLLLCGESGLGKTHLSLSIGKLAIDKGFDVLYLPFNALINTLEAAKFRRQSEEGYLDYLAPVLECELLILDDVGSEFGSPFCTSTLYDIINSRLLSSSPIIINTNIPPDDISARYNERIASRLKGCFEVLWFVGEDVRIKKRYFNK